MEIKLAEALLRRKELSEKINILRHFKDNQLYYEVRGQRVAVDKGIEDLNMNIPKLTASQVTAEYDFYARQLRLIDGHIQHLNWVTPMPDNAHECMTDYTPLTQA